MENRPLGGESEREQGYIEGRRRTLMNLLSHALKELRGFGPEDDPLIKIAQLVKEREETVSKLREVCAEHGDNEWPENLHLADVIDKHLARHLGD